MALHGHVAVGMVGIVVVEANGEVAAELLHGLAAQQLLAHGLDEGEEGRFELVLPQLGHDGDLHGDHVEDPGAVAHLFGQVAELREIEAAPDALQVHRTAAEGPLAQLPEQGEQVGEGDQLHIGRFVGGDVVIQPSGADQAPAHVHADLEIHVVIPAHQQAVGQVRLAAQVAGVAVLEIQGRGAGGDVHPHADVVGVLQLGSQGAAAVHQHRFLRLQGLPQGLDLSRVLQARVAAFVAPPVQQHGVLLPVLRQVGLQHFGDLVGILQQGIGVHIMHLRAAQLLAHHVHQGRHVRAGIGVHGDVLAFLQQGGDLLGHGDGALHRGHAPAGDHVDGVMVDVGIGMEHEAHSFTLLVSLLRFYGAFFTDIVPDDADDGRGDDDHAAQHALPGMVHIVVDQAQHG